MKVGCRLTIGSLTGKVAQIDDEVRLPLNHCIKEFTKQTVMPRASLQVTVRTYAKSNTHVALPFCHYSLAAKRQFWLKEVYLSIADGTIFEIEEAFQPS